MEPLFNRILRRAAPLLLGAAALLLPRTACGQDSGRILYLHGDNGWGGVSEGWRAQEKILEGKDEAQLDSMARFSRLPAGRAAAYMRLAGHRSRRCFDVVMSALPDTSTILLINLDLGIDMGVVDFMVSLSGSGGLFTPGQWHTLDSAIVFTPGLDHVDKLSSIRRLPASMPGLHDRVRGMAVAGDYTLFEVLAGYRMQEDVPLLVEALLDYRRGLDGEGANTLGPKGGTNFALAAIAGWADPAFVPVLEEIGGFELTRRHLDYTRLRNLFKAVMGFDDDWAYRYLEDYFGRRGASDREYFRRELYAAYHGIPEQERGTRFGPLVDKYAGKPGDRDR